MRWLRQKEASSSNGNGVFEHIHGLVQRHLCVLNENAAGIPLGKHLSPSLQTGEKLLTQ